MYSNKIKICADVHYCQSYYDYIKISLDNFMEDVKRDRPLITVISGDYFDRRMNSDDPIYIKAVDYLIEIAKNTKHLLVVQGTYSHDYDTLDILESLSTIQGNITFTKDITKLSLEGYDILCIPEAYPRDPNEYYSDYFQHKYDFIFGHGDIEGAVLHSGIDNTKLNGFRFSPKTLSSISRYCVFGHIHKHQFLRENVCYPGSLGRWRYGEEEDKGYLEIDLDLDIIKFNKVESYSFETVVINNENDLEAFKRELELNNGNINNIRVKMSKDLKDHKKVFIEDEFIKNLGTEFNFEYIDEKEDYGDDLIYGEISKLSVSEQYFKMFEFEKEQKKIPLKKLNEFMSDEMFEKKVKDIIYSVSNTEDA